MTTIAPITETVKGGGALTAQEQFSGVMGLANLSQEDFESRLAVLKKGQERIRAIQRELMVEDEDYGVIPGTNKPGLFKAGAEKLCMVYGLRPSFDPTITEGDGVSAPVLRVRMVCRLHVGSDQGPVVSEGVGAANSWEKKHRWRRGERACPECGVAGSVIKGKPEYGGGWLCWAKKDGCGAKFKEDDARITEQAVGDVENTDQYDLENTLLKMAKKRAYVDATLTATATSGFFTQDVEDMPQLERAVKAEAPRQEREPGSDDAPVVETSAGPVKIGSGEHAEAAGAKDYNKGADTRAIGKTAPCPSCGKPAGPSKFAKPGKTHYAYCCKVAFDPSGARA